MDTRGDRELTAPWGVSLLNNGLISVFALK